MTDWRDLFVGRDSDLKILQDAWYKIQPADSSVKIKPQLIVVLGERGLGKTKLVQEFYRWLSQCHDPVSDQSPNGYWPDSFLGEQESLDVNPQFLPEHKSNASIPWMWWGLRFSDSDERNVAGSRCGLSDSYPALDLHLAPLKAARKLKLIRNELIWSTVAMPGKLVPGSAWIFGTRDILRHRNILKNEKELLKTIETSRAEASSDNQTRLEELVCDFFCTVLNRNNHEADTVPVVIFMDNAQSADTLTLKFIRALLIEARKKSWPLLVVCTHYEREWHEHRNQQQASADSSESLAEIVDELRIAEEDYHPWIRTHTLPAVPDLSEVLTTAFPGLTEMQRNHFLMKAGGNPLYLAEAIEYFLKNPDFFEDKNFKKCLTDDGFQDLNKLPIELPQLVESRFAGMDDAVKQVLGWSSEQGQTFLTQITLACAQRVDEANSDDSVRSALRRAQHPYSQIKLHGDCIRFTRSEFRQALFQEAANSFLHRRKSVLNCVQSAIRESLSEWMSSGYIDELATEERLDALLITQRHLSPLESEPDHIRRGWCVAMQRLASVYRDQFLWDQAFATVTQWAEATTNGWPLDWIAFEHQLDSINLLQIGSRQDLARKIIEPLVANLEHVAKDEPENERALQMLATALNAIGSLQVEEGDYEQALSSYRRAIGILEQSIRQFGESLRSLLELAISRQYVGRVETSQGQYEEAKKQFGRAIGIHFHIAKEFGDPLENLRIWNLTLAAVGDVAMAEGQLEIAMEMHDTSREILERLVAQYAERSDFLGELCRLLVNAGTVAATTGLHEKAMNLYERAIDNSEKFIDQFGETPMSLLLSVVPLWHTGKLHRSLGKNDDAIVAYKHAQEIAQKIVKEFPETPESLKTLSLLFFDIGELNHLDGCHNEALEAYESGAEISQRTVDLFPDRLEHLKLFCLLQSRVGNSYFFAGRHDDALNACTKADKVARQIVNQFEETADNHRLLAVALSNIAEIKESQGNLEEAISKFESAVEIFEQIVDRFAATQESLNDLYSFKSKLSRSQWKLGQIDQALKSCNAALDVIGRIYDHRWNTPDHEFARREIQKMIIRIRSGRSSPTTDKKGLADRDTPRQVAEWILSVNGSLMLKGSDQWIEKIDDLPPDDQITVTKVWLWEKQYGADPIRSDDLLTIAKLTELEELNVRGQKIGDTMTQVLTDLKKLEVLDLHACGITDESFPRIAKMKQLRRLDVGYSHRKITDKGVSSLADLHNLERLCLFLSAITDDSLQILGTLPKLKYVEVKATDVTDEGVENLESRVPDLKVGR